MCMNNTNTTPAKKITKTTFKSFIKRYANDLMINVSSAFDGQIDGSASFKKDFSKIEKSDRNFPDYDFGIAGVWIVGGGRDHFSHYEEGGLIGITVCNSCRTFTVAVAEWDYKG